MFGAIIAAGLEGVGIGAIIGAFGGLIVGGVFGGGKVSHEGGLHIKTGKAGPQIKWAFILAIIGAVIGGIISASGHKH